MATEVKKSSIVSPGMSVISSILAFAVVSLYKKSMRFKSVSPISTHPL